MKVDEETKRRMERLPGVNWSEVLRKALRARLDFEESLRTPIDRRRAIAASRRIDAFREALPPSPDFDSTREIRKWRDRNRQSKRRPSP